MIWNVGKNKSTTSIVRNDDDRSNECKNPTSEQPKVTQNSSKPWAWELPSAFKWIHQPKGTANDKDE